MKKKGESLELFLELAGPFKNGVSREVKVSEFKDKYSDLKLGNGGGWCRDDGFVAKKYRIHRIRGRDKKEITSIKLELKDLKNMLTSKNYKPKKK